MHTDHEQLIASTGDEFLSIQWFPGHMARTRRLIKERLKLVDVAVELCDSRIPVSSRNPEIETLLADRPRLLLLNKCDLADDRATRQWIDALSTGAVRPLAVDCKSGHGLDRLALAAAELTREKRERQQAKGVKNRPIRMMVVGVPNVGKSQLINRLCGHSHAKVENRPGVTRSVQWYISKDNRIELLDTPGVLWPKFDDPSVGEHLAFTGAIKDAVLDIEGLAVRLLARLLALPAADYPGLLETRYKLDAADLVLPPHEPLSRIGQRRGMMLRGGEVDTERTANMLMEEFRTLKIGRVTLEWVG